MENFLLDRIASAPISDFPFRHFNTKAFPDDFYSEILKNLPDPDLMPQIGRVRGSGGLSKYQERFAFLVGDGGQLRKLPKEQGKFWGEFSQWLCSGRLARLVLDKFEIDRAGKFRNDVYLVRDVAGYALGPHTDTPKKAVTLIFYLAPNDKHPELGTSLYTGQPDPIGKHHDKDGFERVGLAPYLPNSVFGFRRTDVSFHGVEKTTSDRWNLLFDVQYA